MSSCGADSKSQFYIIDSIDVYSLSGVYLIVRILCLFASGSTTKRVIVIYPGRTLIWYAKSKTGFGSSTLKIRPENWPRTLVGSSAAT